MSTTFAELGLPDIMTATLEQRGITTPFPIQAIAIPAALAGRDVCGRAPTGSGKTLAFGLPALARVERARPHRPRALILSPTRELAEQIRTELEAPARGVGRRIVAVYGGVGYGPQRSQLGRGVDVLVACPGRLEDLIAQGAVDLSDVGLVVVDEADRLADMGFLPAVRRLIDMTSSDRQTLLFSATLDGDVAVLIRRYQRHPVRLESDVQKDTASRARHHFWRVEQADRVARTADAIAAAHPAIVFTRTRHRADRLVRELRRVGLSADALHGGLSQRQRRQALAAFMAGKAQALVATDVAARGLHIEAVASVVHFDPPSDGKMYVHRSGRTARAGASGTVVSLVDGTQISATMRMQRSLGIKAPISAPKTEDLRGPTAIGEESGPPPRPVSGDRPKGHQNSKRQVMEGRSIYVGNLPFAFASSDLEALFRDYGPVDSAAVITHPGSTRSRGFGFVEMPDTMATRAIAALHGSELRGRRLTVRSARPRSEPRRHSGHAV